MAHDSAADFITANPDWATAMVYAGAPGTVPARLIAQVGPNTPAGTKGWVWDQANPPWFVPLPPA